MQDRRNKTEQMVMEMREKRAAGATIPSLAIEYDRSEATVLLTCRGYQHKEKNGPITGRRKGKLTRQQIFEILRCYETGETLKSIGADYNRTESAMSLIVRGKRYPGIVKECQAALAKSQASSRAGRRVSG